MKKLFLAMAICSAVSAQPGWIGGGYNPAPAQGDWEMMDEKHASYPSQEEFQASPLSLPTRAKPQPSQRLASIRNRLDAMQIPQAAVPGPQDYGVSFGSAQPMQESQEIPSAPMNYAQPAQTMVPAQMAPISPSGTHRTVEQEKRMISLLERCKSLSPWLENNQEKGEQARALYREHCNDVISRVALEEKLDVFYPVQGKYLMLTGDMAQANRFLTLNYQHRPTDFEANLMLAKNLVSLNQAQMAYELLEFFQARFPDKVGPQEAAAMNAVLGNLSSTQGTDVARMQ